MRLVIPLIAASICVTGAVATLNVAEYDTAITLSNDRLTAVLSKKAGLAVDLSLDGQDLLGPQSGSVGIGPYLDCYCIPSGFYQPGTTTPPRMQTVEGIDSTGTKYGGAIMTDTYIPTGQQFQQYWFLRDGETGLHMFSRLAYYNETTPFLRNLQEFRTLFRPNTGLWTHLTSSEIQTAPLPSRDAVKHEVVVQDATWRLNNTPDDPYYTQFAEYFTKYTFSNSRLLWSVPVFDYCCVGLIDICAGWRDNNVHGLYADGSTSNGTTYGAWLVMNTKVSRKKTGDKCFY